MGRARMLAVAAVVTASCSSPSAPTAAPPDWYAERDELPSCGTLVFEDYDPPEGLEESTRCLLDAFEDGEPAELEITQLTDEGDPVTSIYRASTGGELELLTDWTQDEFGPDAYTRALCSSLERGADGGPLPIGCQEIDHDEAVG